MSLFTRIALGLALFLCLNVTALAQEKIDLDSRALIASIDRQLATPSVVAATLSATIELPWFADQNIELTLIPASQFEPALQAKYPDTRSYRVTDRQGNYSGRLNTSPQGIFLILLGEAGAVEIDRTDEVDKAEYTIRRIDLQQEMDAFTCGVEDGTKSPETEPTLPKKDNSSFRVGDIKRQYRLALTNTGEFAAANGGTLASVNNAFNDRIAELNTIYETELAISFLLIAGNDALVNLNPATDPFSDPNNTLTSLGQTRNYIRETISPGAYDIGHGLHVSPGGSAGGIAGVGVVCENDKARGYSTIFNGSALVILQHEIGHQFGCSHTNYGCQNTGRQRYEPGQGVSIMGTGADCSSTDRYDDRVNTYFNAGSLRTINTFISNTADCFTPIGVANQPPTSDASAADGKVIPARTAFVLEGRGGDTNNGNLRYNWEQFDTDQNTTALPTQTADIATAPLFRSFAPASAPNRYLPRLTTLLSGETPDGSDGEILPTVDRVLTFNLTVRDGVTGNACDEAGIRVIDTGEPFRITSQNNEPTWRANGSNTETVSWSVAGTAGGEINTPNVDIMLSTDGGLTFPIVLVAATPNDGSHTFIVPSIMTTSGRVMVRGSGNIFLDINDANITLISDGPVCNAAASFLVNEGEMMAVAGDPSLNLDLSPAYGDRLTSPLTFTLDDAADNGNSIAEDQNGDCIAINFQGYFSKLSVTSAGGETIKFRSSGRNGTGNFIPHASLFDRPYTATCANDPLVGSTATFTRTQTGSYRITTKEFVSEINSGSQYDLVAYGNGREATGEVLVAYEGGTLYSVEEAPVNGFSYTYGIVNEGTDNIVAFDPDSDLSDPGQFPGGEYTVFGVSFENGTDLMGYVGRSRQALEGDIAAQRICAASSANEVAVTVSDASLPVELISFNGRTEDGANILDWSTASEVGTESFEVQHRGADENSWIALENVSAENRPAIYTTADRDHSNTDSYYRLRIIDFDGYIEYSKIIFLPAVLKGNGNKLYPNPITAGELLTITGLTEGARQVRLFDLSGRVVYSTSATAADGVLNFPLPAGLVGGVYYVRLRNGSGVRSEVVLVR